MVRMSQANYDHAIDELCVTKFGSGSVTQPSQSFNHEAIEV